MPANIEGNNYGINEGAFYNHSKLKSVIISSGVISIGESAFNIRCCFYYDGTIEDWCKMKFSGKLALFPRLLKFYFRNSNNEWEEVKNIEIPNTITKIGDYQFYGFNNVISITIPNSITNIENYAFFACSSLKEVFYDGTSADWRRITIEKHNENLVSATIYYYLEAEPTEEGNYWHYVDGVPTKW